MIGNAFVWHKNLYLLINLEVLYAEKNFYHAVYNLSS